LAVRKIGHSGAELHAAAKASSSLYWLQPGSDNLASNVRRNGTKESAYSALNTNWAVLVTVFWNHIQASCDQ
jgi:hypothetical protein